MALVLLRQASASYQPRLEVAPLASVPSHWVVLTAPGLESSWVAVSMDRHPQSYGPVSRWVQHVEDAGGQRA